MHCMPCHSGTNIGAMPLNNYKEARAYGRMIQYVTENKIMPPWKADDSHAKLKNYNRLTEAETKAIKKWVADGMPAGKMTDTTGATGTNPTITQVEPTLVLAMTKPFTVSGNFTETAQVFVLPTNLAKDELITAIEFVPGNKKIVKSCTISIDTGQTGVRYDNNDHTYGYRSLTGLGFIPYQYNWYQWTAEERPGYTVLPVAKKISAGSRLLLHINYAATTTTQDDSSFVKFRFAKHGDTATWVSSEVLLDTTRITNGPFLINKGEKRKFFAVARLEKATEIHGIMPMGQNALSSWEIYAVDSTTGNRFELLKIPYWDAHWKKKYILETPVHLSAGSKIMGTAFYNNSDGNPNLIILPPKKIGYGEGQRDELFIVQFDVVYKDPDHQ